MFYSTHIKRLYVLANDSDKMAGAESCRLRFGVLLVNICRFPGWLCFSFPVAVSLNLAATAFLVFILGTEISPYSSIYTFSNS